MRYSIGDKVEIGGAGYSIDGFIRYRDAEGYQWMEYLLRAPGEEKWLTYDPSVGFELAQSTSQSMPPTGYSLKEVGRQICIESAGPVDTDPGESAGYEDYADSAGNTFSIERWDGETEFSKGWHLEPGDIKVNGVLQSEVVLDDDFGPMPGGGKSGGSKGLRSIVEWLAIIAVIGAVGVYVAGAFNYCSDSGGSTPSVTMKEYCVAHYERVTSATGSNGDNAEVFESPDDVETTAKAIIDSQKGSFEKVQSSNDGKCVSLMNDAEYCLVYTASDDDLKSSEVPSNSDVAAPKDGTTLVQVSTRQYAYENDSQPYHSSRAHYLFWRGFYSTYGYSRDSTRYESSTSPYKTNRGETIQANASDPYTNYSSTVRDEAVRARSRSGGTSSGK